MGVTDMKAAPVTTGCICVARDTSACSDTSPSVEIEHGSVRCTRKDKTPCEGEEK